MALKGQVWSIDNVFIDTTIWDGKDIAVLLDNDETSSLNSPFFYLAVARDGQWLTGGNGNWNGLALATANYPLAQVLVIGPQGQVHITGSGDRLTQSGGLMASTGERDLFSFDGTNWTRID